MNVNDTAVSAPAEPSVPSSRSSAGVTDPSVARLPANPSLTTDAESVAPQGQAVTGDPHSHPSQRISAAGELDNATSNWPAQSTPNDRLDIQHHNAPNPYENGVDFQNLLDNLSPPSSAPSAPALPQAISSVGEPAALPVASDESAQATLSLPPRPPPQEKPSIHPNYSHSDDIRCYHQLPAHSSSTPASHSNQDSNHLPYIAATGAPGTSSGSGALPPPPLASFQQSPSSGTGSQELPAQLAQRTDGADNQSGRPHKSTDEDTPWSREVQRKYDEFLHEERVYVTEGLWDRFPLGSRLFVGQYCPSLGYCLSII